MRERGEDVVVCFVLESACLSERASVRACVRLLLLFSATQTYTAL